MSIELLTIDEAIQDNGLKVLVHGPAGAGKTVLASTTEEPTIIINAESGLLSLRAVLREKPELNEYLRVVTIQTITDLGDVFNYLQQEKRCSWICLDSISEIAESVLSHAKKTAKDPRAAYGAMQDEVGDMLRAFRDLPGYNVYMSCKQGLKTDDYSSVTRYRPAMPGQNLPQAIPYMFDEVFALRCEQNEEGVIERRLQTSHDIQYDAKDRSGCLNMFELPNLALIKAKIDAGKKSEPVRQDKEQEEVKEAVGE